ncbi:hypothetical protein IF2G_06683 [Cordyceps javanica]|nr:hypothetical protein IF2G_06683 [Cordyceps javanica]
MWATYLQGTVQHGHPRPGTAKYLAMNMCKRLSSSTVLHPVSRFPLTAEARIHGFDTSSQAAGHNDRRCRSVGKSLTTGARGKWWPRRSTQQTMTTKQSTLARSCWSAGCLDGRFAVVWRTTQPARTESRSWVSSLFVTVVVPVSRNLARVRRLMQYMAASKLVPLPYISGY